MSVFKVSIEKKKI